MKVLFLHPNRQDYLSDSLFHGLRSLLGEDCVDVPRYDCLYAPLPDGLRSTLRGHGMTLYGLLPDLDGTVERRTSWKTDLESYDLVILANIWAQGELLLELARLVPAHKLILLDGADSPAFFPYAWHLRKRLSAYLKPAARSRYFKRELIGEGHPQRWDQFAPRVLRRHIPIPKNTRPISFAIPEEKIQRSDAELRQKDFPRHIVDPEVSAKVPASLYSKTGSDQYAFNGEEEYYGDLQQSRFGVTTKRAGWDCLRHYELAANGCVLCFRDLDLKPQTCAPHGLDETNCIIYHSFEELQEKICCLTPREYEALQQKTYDWASRNTTVSRAKELIAACL